MWSVLDFLQMVSIWSLSLNGCVEVWNFTTGKKNQEECHVQDYDNFVMNDVILCM